MWHPVIFFNLIDYEQQNNKTTKQQNNKTTESTIKKFIISNLLMMFFLLTSFQVQSQNCPSGPYFLRAKVWVALPNGVPPQNQQGWINLENQISAELQATQAAFNAANNLNETNHEIYFNYIVEYIVAPELEIDPEGFFTGCQSNLYDDPDRIDILIISQPPTQGQYLNGTGAGSSIGGDKLFTVLGLSIVHELGHLLNLRHTHGDAYPCVGDIPNGANWSPGDPYSSAATGDFVADTPVHPVVDNTNTGGGRFDPVFVYTACPNANINWGATSDNCSPASNFPANYSSTIMNGVVTYDNVLERNFMANVFPPGCIMPAGGRVFTNGQGARMRCHIDASKQAFLDNNKMPDQFIDFASGCIAISGLIDFDVVFDDPCYVITSDVTIAGGNVSFIGTEVEVLNQLQNNGAIEGASIFVNEGASLSIQSSNFKGNSECSNWGGIISPGGANMVEISYSHIEDCNSIDLGFASDLNINNSLFRDVSTVNLRNNDVGYTDMNSNAFIGSIITLSNQFMHFQGCKFSDCEITVTNTDGSDVVFERSESYLPYFKNSNIHVVNAGNTVIDDSYFDSDCDNPLVVDQSDYVLVCRSFFNNCTQSLTNFSLTQIDKGNISMNNVNKFYIFHNYFINDDGSNVFTAANSSVTSLIQNNIFEGVCNYDINTQYNINVDISCNYHEDPGWAWATNELITQGNPSHPAGNTFDNSQGIINNGTIFDYFYNLVNPLEYPDLQYPGSVDRIGIPPAGAGSVCLSRAVIARIWNWHELCFPSFWTNWPECMDKICLDCIDLPPPTRISEEAEGRAINDNNQLFGTLQSLESQETDNRSIALFESLINPNPFSDVINLNIKEKVVDLTVSIISIDGKVLNIDSLTSTLDLSFLENGIYLLLIKDIDQNVLVNEKIIKI